MTQPYQPSNQETSVFPHISAEGPLLWGYPGTFVKNLISGDTSPAILSETLGARHIGVCFFEASGSRLEKRVKTVFFGAG